MLSTCADGQQGVGRDSWTNVKGWSFDARTYSDIFGMDLEGGRYGIMYLSLIHNLIGLQLSTER